MASKGSREEHTEVGALLSEPIDDNEATPNDFLDADTQILNQPAPEPNPDTTRAQPTSRAAEIGEHIGRYRLDGLLGEGGGGSVFLATDTGSGEEVAIKVLASHLAGDAEYSSRFFHEARIVRELAHPNIVQILDFIETDTPRRVAYVMELVDGVPLSQLQALRRLEVGEALTIALQLAHALEAVHKLNVVHRDLKPENILVSGYESPSDTLTIKVLDFGVAKFSEDVGHHTRTGAMLGTPRYMAPEQLFDEPITPKTDVYALGEIFYEALTGARAFEGDNRAVMTAKSKDAPALALTFPSDLPCEDQIRPLILACLAQNPAQRPAVKDFWGRLIAIVAHMPPDQVARVVIPEAPRESWVPPMGRLGQPPLVVGVRESHEPEALPEPRAPETSIPTAKRSLSPRTKRLLATIALLVPLLTVGAYASAPSESREALLDSIGLASSVIVSHPPGAEISVDGVVVCPLGALRCPTQLSHGHHQIDARLPLHQALRRSVPVTTSGEIAMDLKPEHAELQISTTPPRVLVSVGGKPAGLSPISQYPVSPGDVEISVEDPCFEPAKRTVRAELGSLTRVDLGLQAKRSTLKVAAVGPRKEAVEADVYIDDQRVGHTPLRLEVSVCAKRLTLQHASLGIWKKKLKLESGTTTSFEPILGNELLVPAGEFTMGCSEQNRDCDEDELPEHVLTIDAFLIDKTEVSAAAYEACVKAGACNADKTDGFEWKGQPFTPSKDCNYGTKRKGRHPMNCISFSQAEAYCRFKRMRLPTEAEWEKAARGPDKRLYPWGNTPPTCELAALGLPGTTCASTGTRTVKSLVSGASPYGALHMLGNVEEWVADYYEEHYYARSPAVNPTGPQAGNMRVVRGGHFAVKDANGLLVTDRRGLAENFRNVSLGFRCARAAVDTPAPIKSP